MNMRFYWLKDRESVDQFRYYWKPGTRENKLGRLLDQTSSSIASLEYSGSNIVKQTSKGGHSKSNESSSANNDG